MVKRPQVKFSKFDHLGGIVMAENSGAGTTGVVAILVIFVIIVVAALFVFGGRLLNGNKRVDVNIQTPSK